MSKLGYFLSGALAGVVGTVVAVYAVNACFPSGTGANQALESDESDSVKEGGTVMEANPFAATTNAECSA